MLYELTPHQIARVRACARAMLNEIPESTRAAMLAEACRHGALSAVPSGWNPDALHVGLEDPDDVRVAWAGRHLLTVSRAALASDEPLADVGELLRAPDDPRELLG